MKTPLILMIIAFGFYSTIVMANNPESLTQQQSIQQQLDKLSNPNSPHPQQQ